jgi:PEP-CTERM motif
MNRFIKCAVLSLLMTGISQAATLTFTDSGAGHYATGFGDNLANIDDGLIWGIVVDTTGNGFATSNWSAGFDYSGGNTTGIALVNSLGVMTDDVLFINSTVTSNLNSAADGAAAGVGRVNSINSVEFGVATTYNGASGTNPTVGAGQAFAIIWFDRGIALSSTSSSGQRFGLATSGNIVSPAFTLPGSSGANADYAPAFAGADTLRTTAFALIPEPSTFLLASLGVLGLLRRRR